MAFVDSSIQQLSKLWANEYLKFAIIALNNRKQKSMRRSSFLVNRVIFNVAESIEK